MKNLNYKGKGEHSVNELELIIEQQAEELHLLKSGQLIPKAFGASISPAGKKALMQHYHGNNNKRLLEFVDREFKILLQK